MIELIHIRYMPLSTALKGQRWFLKTLKPDSLLWENWMAPYEGQIVLILTGVLLYPENDYLPIQLTNLETSYTGDYVELLERFDAIKSFYERRDRVESTD